ncbi:MAG: helix-turn-helix domain-containing protein [Desulfovibrio sp.]|nr:helix-turn-helix domain-containing protein [Desulfovibrio sp.]
MFGYGYFGRYVSVGEKKVKAQKALAKMRKAGLEAKPIEEFRGKIASTFWGKSWCENLESYADYENRIARGRSYLRNGFVCHLEIEQGIVRAKVYGTSLYDITITIKTLSQERWQEVCERCAGQIGSLMELLQGKFSKEIMKIVCDKEHGIFPAPNEIKFKCSCPDWASMCKHVAAVLYGIGRRLDTQPDLLFTLRGVDPSELLAQNLESVTESSRDDALAVENVGELFGIDFVEEANLPDLSPKSTKGKARGKKTDAQVKARATQEKTAESAQSAGKANNTLPKAQATSKAQAKKESSASSDKSGPTPSASALQACATSAKGRDGAEPDVTGPFDPKAPTADAIRKLRTLAGLTQAEFARKLMVSTGSLTRWENCHGRIGLSDASLAALANFQKQWLVAHNKS